ncbi:DUF5673 domain-containing protein [Clostridium oceanicum]|uniref:DUF5673 domain-containing protein n=1 Tax=Clostridium oceanicum TaxID=1543 RepID=A0ABP3UK29_9CLOT
MFNIHGIQIMFFILLTVIIGVLIFNQYSIIKMSGETIIKRRNTMTMILVTIVTALCIGALDYYDEYMLNILDILHILMCSLLSLQIVSSFSTKFYTISKNGISIGFFAFSKWEDIKGYDIENSFLKIQTRKDIIVRKMKIEENSIKRIQEIIEKNKILPIT